MNATEIERKFHLNARDAQSLAARASKKVDIAQVYLAKTEQREIRLRKRDEEYLLTIKSNGGLKRNEYEIVLSQSQSEEMKGLLTQPEIIKTRYEIPLGEKLIELDQFGGKLEGLWLAEIEFDSKDSAQQFEAPKSFGKELTNDPDFKNKNLAGSSLKELKLRHDFL